MRQALRSRCGSCSPDHQILFLSLLAFLLAFCSQRAAVLIIRNRHSVLMVCSSGFKRSEGETQLTPIQEARPTTTPAILYSSWSPICSMHPWLAAFPLRASGIGTVHCIIAAQIWVS
ncbi:hypothetical protein F5J12DRAFT_354097 [Pisolithus orientalis]|uniref:uncharacterized protein n=1 Tax=Pisolithus orientalis TaxID=936130 RepID=UPI002224D8BD|nr:uncharacterized protein F5J12DRAFT_354097 [Pisolithus orientalis]KAI5996432.1 hypothetical protein F5J12DRAFT_354097 [Pisolithus orientalis]